ncbi:hypothetical protein VTO73DRAFT_5009 [Trametes versicolor]
MIVVVVTGRPLGTSRMPAAASVSRLAPPSLSRRPSPAIVSCSPASLPASFAIRFCVLRVRDSSLFDIVHAPRSTGFASFYVIFIVIAFVVASLATPVYS